MSYAGVCTRISTILISAKTYQTICTTNSKNSKTCKPENGNFIKVEEPRGWKNTSYIKKTIRASLQIMYSSYALSHGC